MTQASGNVVSLETRARFSLKESADVIAGCRTLARDRMSAALSAMLDHLEDDLFDLAEKAADRDARDTYLDARAKAREKRRDIEAIFARHFVDLFDTKARRGAASASAAAGDETELKLVGEEDLEESIAVQEMSRKLEAACEGELGALSERMGFLMEKPELENEANPLSPATVCAAFKDACDEIQAGFKVRMTLLRQFERHAAAALERVYRELNSHLVERRVLPEVRAGMPRASMLRKHKASQAPQVARAPERREAAPAPSTAIPPPSSAQAATPVFTALAQLLGNSLGRAGAGTAMPLPTSLARPAPAPFVAELTRMHRAGSPPDAGAQALLNIVKSVKAAPQGAALGHVDATTIDLVSLLFDHIFDDGHIPTSIKALLGRMQIPVLKAALLDKNFFSSRSHPARRLLDLLARASMGVDERARDGPVLTLVEGVVERVLHEFDTDVRLFESVAATVAAFIDERERAEAAMVARSAGVIEERELDEAAHDQAAYDVEQRLVARSPVPLPVRDILRGAWVQVLAKAARKDGEGSPRRAALAATMDDLLWSVEAKPGADDRKRLVAMLPGLLLRLREGMEGAGLTAQERRAFFTALADCHASAVNAGLAGGAVSEPRAEPVAPVPRIECSVVAAEGIQLAEIRLRGAVSRPLNVFTRTGIWTNLQRGTWVEFHTAEGASTRARLTWISPNKGVYLFTNPLAADAAVSISPEALAEQLRTGGAKLIDGGSLVDRAVSSMLSELRAA